MSGFNTLGTDTLALQQASRMNAVESKHHHQPKAKPRKSKQQRAARKRNRK